MATSGHSSKRARASAAMNFMSALVAVLLVCCAHAGAIDPRHFVGAPFLALGFMPMLAVALLVLAVALLCRRWLAALLLVASLAIAAPMVAAHIPVNGIKSMPGAAHGVLRVMTYNVLAFNYGEPDLSALPSQTMRLILDANPDVVVMQEGSARGLDLDSLPSLAPYSREIRDKFPYRYCAKDGLNIMSKYPFTATTLGEPLVARSPLGYDRDQTSYLARAYDLQLPDGKQVRLIDFRLQSYHLSFGKSYNARVSPHVVPSPLERMHRSFALRRSNAQAVRAALDASPPNVILCGDMNDIAMSNAYRIIRGGDMRDAWQDAGSGYAPTYNRHHLPFRIDHILYRGALTAVSIQRIKGGSSDHYPLMAAFDIGDVGNK